MKCVICHGDEIKIIQTQEEIRVGNDIVCVPVTIPTCNNCGEKYYDRRTMQFLEGIEGKVSMKQGELREVGKVFSI